MNSTDIGLAVAPSLYIKEEVIEFMNEEDENTLADCDPLSSGNDSDHINIKPEIKEESDCTASSFNMTDVCQTIEEDEQRILNALNVKAESSLTTGDFRRIKDAALHCHLDMNLMRGVNLEHLIVFLPILYSSYLLAVLWCLTQHNVRLQIQKLSRIMLSEGLTKELPRKRRCWSRISELASATGHSQGIACGGMSLSVLVFVIISVYGRLTLLLDYAKVAGKVEFQLVFPVVVASVFLFLMVDAAHRTTREVGVNFSSLILNMQYSWVDKEALLEVSLFLSTMSANPPIVTYAGFVVVNRHLFVSFVSSSVTYIVMLVQYRMK